MARQRRQPKRGWIFEAVQVDLTYNGTTQETAWDNLIFGETFAALEPLQDDKTGWVIDRILVDYILHWTVRAEEDGRQRVRPVGLFLGTMNALAATPGIHTDNFWSNNFQEEVLKRCFHEKLCPAYCDFAIPATAGEDISTEAGSPTGRYSWAPFWGPAMGQLDVSPRANLFTDDALVLGISALPPAGGNQWINGDVVSAHMGVRVLFHEKGSYV